LSLAGNSIYRCRLEAAFTYISVAESFPDSIAFLFQATPGDKNPPPLCIRRAVAEQGNSEGVS
jgi:hypothetical protein